MNYQDTSSSIGASDSAPDARNDVDVIAAGSRGPAAGNTITGAGTVTGNAGADLVTDGPGQVVTVQGAGGNASVNGGSAEVAGQYGVLNIEASGSYRYTRNADTPDGVRDVFTYTLADASGDRDMATLTIDIGRNPAAVAANAQQMIVGPDGVVTLPEGVTLADVHVVGRNLVIDMPDGTQMIIIDGAVFVPQLVLGGVEVPASNLAALLIDAEPQPAAGSPQSSGGNFGLPPGPLDPGVPLGDLIPPTELTYNPPDVEEIGQFLDREPEIFIDPGDGNPVENAVDQVNEAGLPARTVNNSAEPAGSNAAAASETTTGTIVYESPDEPNQITIDGLGAGGPIVITSVGQTILGQYGTLTITSISDGAIGYSYTLADNTSGDTTHDDFVVTITDNDGDTDIATLRIDIVDDVPTARPDTDSIAAGQFGPATGNVITDAHPGDQGDTDTNAADTVGADNARVTSIDNTANSTAAQTVPNGGSVVVQGQYGLLTIFSNGDYSYTRSENTPGGVTETFSYTITDGDGDPSTSTLTITIADRLVTVGENPLVRTDDDAVPNEGGNPGTPEVGDDADAVNLTGTLSGSGGDGTLTFDLLTSGAPAGFSYVDGPNGSVLVQQVQNGSTVTVLTITVNATSGAYTVTQNNPILHPTLNNAEGDNTENNVSFTINYTVTDLDGDTGNGTLTINVDDDTPVASEATLGGTVDEDGLEAGIAGGTHDVEGEATTATGNVSSLFSAGADNPLTYSLLADTSGLPSLTSNGAAVTYSVSGNTLTASANGSPVFTFTVNATSGAYTFELLGQLDHDSLDNEEVGDDTENPTGTDIQIALGSIIQATDADGDSVTAGDRGLVITVDDDTPEASEAELGGTVDEDGLEAGIAGGVNDVAGEGTTVSGTVAALFNSGADQPLTYALLTDTSGLPELTSNDVAVTYDVDFNSETGVYTLTASAGETVVFTFTLDSETGAYEFELLGQLDHDSLDGLTGDDTENPTGTDIQIALGSIIQATDADGDSVTANDSGLVIVVDDDTPEAVTNVGVGGTVDEDGLEAGIAGGVNDVAGEGTLVEGDVSALFNSGADQPLAYSLLTDTSGLPQLTSNNVAVTYVVDGNTLTAWAGQTPIFTFTLDAQTGEYSFELQGQLDHDSLDGETGDDTENPADSDIAIDLSSIVQATDADGDSVTAADGGLVIIVDDDTPEASEREIDATVDEDGLEAGIAGGVNDAAGEDTTANGTVAVLFASGADQPLTYSLSTDTSGLPDLTSGDVAVTYAVTFNAQTGVYTLTASAGANNPVFTFTLDSETGAYEFELLGQLDHDSLDGLTGDDTENPTGTDIEIALGSIIQATDADGDSVTANDSGLVITVDDDTPTANLETKLTELVDEDGLEDGNVTPRTGDAAGEATTGSGNVATLFNSGADQPLTYALLLDTSGLPQDLTSNGVAVTYAVTVADGVYTLTASAGTTPVFTLTLDSATGAYEFELLDQLDHDSLDGLAGDNTENPAGTDIAIDFSSIIEATDADGDSVVAAEGGLIVTVDDDMPDEFDDCPEEVIAINDAGTIVANLDLNLPPVGADEPGTVSFVVEDGDPVMDNNGQQLSAEGELLYYFVNEEGALEARIGGEDGDPVFTITLNGDGTYTYEQHLDITSTTTLSIVDLSSVGGGNVDAKAIDVPDTPFDLILSTQNGNTVNTNATEMGVGQGQSFEAGENLRIDLVQNAFVSGSGGGAVLNFGEYYTATAYRQDVSGVGNDDGTGGPQRADFIVRAIVVAEAGGSDPSDPADGDNIFYGDGNDTFLTGTSLNIYNSTGQLVDPSAYAGLGITVTNVTTGWQIQGLPNGYDFEIVSTTAFNAVQVEAITGTDTFKLGFIDITSVVQTEVDLTVPIALTDADGDSVVCDIEVHLGPPVSSPNITILVDEAALNNVGSNPGSTAETQTGELSAFVSGGNEPYQFALVGDGLGDFGTLTIEPDGTYTYTLHTPVDSDPAADDGRNVEAGVEQFTYQITDANGITQTATITINVIDDEPDAEPDADSVTDGGPLVATGNVLTDAHPGDEGDTDDGADTIGADQPGAVVNVAFGAGTPVSAGTALAGKYGSLTLNANGDYTYTLNPSDADYGDIIALDSGEFLNEVFTYTMVDADGDQSQTTLVVRINGINNAPTISSATAVVSEEGLQGGNQDSVQESGFDDLPPAGLDDTNSPTAEGDLTVADVDGESLTVSLDVPSGSYQTANGAAITWAVSNGGHTLTGTANGQPAVVVTITDAGHYTVTLSQPINHGEDGDTESEVTLSVPVTVDDGTTEGSATLTIHIEDDKPVLNVTKGSDSAIELVTQDADTDGTPTHSDSSGAVNFAGVFGLTQSVGGDGGATPTLTYTLGHQAGASGLTTGGNTIYLYKIGDNIVGSTSATQDGVVTDNKVFEVSVVATGVNAGQVTLVQYQQIDHGDVGSLTDDEISLADAKITLTASTSISDADGDGLSDSETIHIGANLVFQDDEPAASNDSDEIVSGSNAPATGNVITGSVIGPIVADDSNTTDGTADAVGADVPAKIVAVAFDGQVTNLVNGVAVVEGDFGTLTIYENGDYSYARDSGTPGNAGDTFTYTLEDFDGDQAQADLVITIEDAGVTVSIPTGEAETYVYETALGTTPQGRSEAAAPGANDDPNEVVTGTITFNALDGLGSISIGGVLLTGTYPQTIVDNSTGTLKVTGVAYNSGTGAGSISYEYTLKDNTLGDAPPASGNTTVTFDVDIVDGDGDHSPDGNLVITIVDDDPRANDDLGISVNEGGTVGGNALNNDLSGADGYMASPNGAVIQITSVNQSTSDLTADGSGNFVLRGQYGELTLNRDGTYSYKADADIASLPAGAKDTFTYTVRDGDGDTDPATIEFAITPVTVSATDDEALVNEAGLPTIGSDAASDSEKFLTGQIEPSGGIGSYTYTLTSLNGGNGTYGTLTLNSDGSYSYVLDTPYDGPDVEGADTVTPAESFTYRVTDGNGNTFNGTIVVSIIDDVPTAWADTDAVTEDTQTSATGNVITGVGSDNVAAGGDTKGADDATVTFVDGLNTGIGSVVPDANGETINGQYGTLLINSAGGYTYTLYTSGAGYNAVQALGSGQSLTETFAYTLTDGDGDESIANLVITINGTNDAPQVTGSSTAVSDEGVAEEAGPPPGAEPNPDTVGIDDTTNLVMRTGSLTITDADAGATFDIDLGIPTGSYTVDGQAITWALNGTNTVLTGSVAGLGEVIKVELTNTSGGWKVTQSHAIDQAGTANTETDIDITVPVTVSDGVATENSSIVITVEDDSPVYTSEVDAAPVLNSATSFAGEFHYRIGGDEHLEWIVDNEIDITAFSGSVGTPGTGDIYGKSIQFVSADATTEVWEIHFSYNAKPGDATTQQTTFATVTFNKATGGYTVVLDDPIQSYATDSVQGAGPSAYTFNGGSGGASQYDSANVRIDSDFYIQLTGDVGNTKTPFQTQGATFDHGDTFIGADSWVSISSTDIAAGGNSLQSKNIMDLNFYDADPETTTNATPTAGALGTFVIVDQMIPSEDIVVVLKLAAIDANGNVTSAVTTRAIAVNYNDLFTSATKPAAYGDVTLTGNELLLVIEQGDYAALVPAGYQLVGLQILTSVEGIDGTYYDFDGALGASDTSVLTAAEKASLTDGDVIKIVDVGVVRLVENQEALSLSLNVTVTDGDGDSFNETLLVNPPPATLNAAMVVSQEAVNDNDSSFLLSSESSEEQLRSMNAANTNTALLGAVAAAGLGSSQGLANGFADYGVLANFRDSGVDYSHLAGFNDSVVSTVMLEMASGINQPAGIGAAIGDTYLANIGGSGIGDLGGAIQSLPANEMQIPVTNEAAYGGESMMSALGIGAQAVGMPSADMLAGILGGPQIGSLESHIDQALALAGGVDPVQQTGEVSRVLVDALAGGGGGADIDALLSALPVRDGGWAAEALASHGPGAVSAWDMGGFGGFTAFQPAFTMEAVVLHQDAVQTV